MEHIEEIMMVIIIVHVLQVKTMLRDQARKNNGIWKVAR